METVTGLVIVALVIAFVVFLFRSDQRRQLRDGASPHSQPPQSTAVHTVDFGRLSKEQQRQARRYRESLDAFERDLQQFRYASIFEQRLKDRKWAQEFGQYFKFDRWSDRELSIEDCNEILSSLNTSPRELALLEVPPPRMPELPTIPMELETAGFEFVFEKAKQSLDVARASIEADLNRERR